MRRLLLAITVVTAGGLSSCATDNAPKPGSPAYLWAAANETFAANDFVKTSEHLDKILASDNEYTARARAWSLILISGMARGYMDLADNFEYGVKAKKAVAVSAHVSDAKTSEAIPYAPSTAISP